MLPSSFISATDALRDSAAGAALMALAILAASVFGAAACAVPMIARRNGVSSGLTYLRAKVLIFPSRLLPFAIVPASRPYVQLTEMRQITRGSPIRATEVTAGHCLSFEISGAYF